MRPGPNPDDQYASGLHDLCERDPLFAQRCAVHGVSDHALASLGWLCKRDGLPVAAIAEALAALDGREVTTRSFHVLTWAHPAAEQLCDQVLARQRCQMARIARLRVRPWLVDDVVAEAELGLWRYLVTHLEERPAGRVDCLDALAYRIVENQAKAARRSWNRATRLRDALDGWARTIAPTRRGRDLDDVPVRLPDLDDAVRWQDYRAAADSAPNPVLAHLLLDAAEGRIDRPSLRALTRLGFGSLHEVRQDVDRAHRCFEAVHRAEDADGDSLGGA
jgi:hypothetical protein